MTKEEFRSIRADKLKLNQIQLAEKLGISQSAVSRLETGEVPIDRRTEMALQLLLANPRPARARAAA